MTQQRRNQDLLEKRKTLQAKLEAAREESVRLRENFKVRGFSVASLLVVNPVLRMTVPPVTCQLPLDTLPDWTNQTCYTADVSSMLTPD